MKNITRTSFASLGAWTTGTALGLLMMTAANAAILVEHAPDFQGVSYASSIDAGLQNADFTFSGNASVTGITWWGTTLSDQADLGLFTVRILSGLGLPDSFVLDPVAPVIQQFAASGGYSMFDLDLSSSPLSLSFGNYYLSIMNESVGGWEWLTGTGGDGSNQYRGLDGDPWTTDPTGDFSLRLTGTPNAIPEPGSALLILMAGAALLAVRRRG